MFTASVSVRGAWRCSVRRSSTWRSSPGVLFAFHVSPPQHNLMHELACMRSSAGFGACTSAAIKANKAKSVKASARSWAREQMFPPLVKDKATASAVHKPRQHQAQHRNNGKLRAHARDQSPELGEALMRRGSEAIRSRQVCRVCNRRQRRTGGAARALVRLCAFVPVCLHPCVRAAYRACAGVVWRRRWLFLWSRFCDAASIPMCLDEPAGLQPLGVNQLARHWGSAGGPK